MLTGLYDIPTREDLIEGRGLPNPGEYDMPEFGGLGSLKSTLKTIGQVATLGLTSYAIGKNPALANTLMMQPNSAVQSSVPTYVVQSTGEVRSPHYVSGPNATQAPAGYASSYQSAGVQQYAGQQYDVYGQPIDDGIFTVLMRDYPIMTLGAGGLLVVMILYGILRR